MMNEVGGDQWQPALAQPPSLLIHNMFFLIKEIAFACPWLQAEELIRGHLEGGHQKKRERTPGTIPAPPPSGAIRNPSGSASCLVAHQDHYWITKSSDPARVERVVCGLCVHRYGLYVLLLPS